VLYEGQAEPDVTMRPLKFTPGHPVSDLALSPSVVISVTQLQPDASVPPFAVLPCSRKALVRGEKSRIELRDLGTGEVLTEWRWGLPRVDALAVAGDGLTAAAASHGGHALIWDLG